MDIKTYRAKTMRDALELVRRELGPSAAVLHTREGNSGPLSRLVFGRRYEVAASAMVNVPSRLPEGTPEEVLGVGRTDNPVRRFEADGQDCPSYSDPTPAFEADYRTRYRDDFRRQVAGQL